MMMGALGQWVETDAKRATTLEFFAIGGGLLLADLADSREPHRLVAENPFTPYMDVEVMPIVEPTAAMQTWGEIASNFAGLAQPVQ